MNKKKPAPPHNNNNQYIEFADRLKKYFSHDLLTFLTEADLDLFLDKRFEFINVRKKNELKIKITHAPLYWQINKTSIEILYEDIYFLLDSLREYFTKKGIEITLVAHPTFLALRDEKSEKLISLENGDNPELYIYIEIEKISTKESLHLEKELRSVIEEVTLCVEDWQSTQHFFNQDLSSYFPASKKITKLIKWIYDNNAIILGNALIKEKMASEDQGDFDILKRYGLFRHKLYKRELEKKIVFLFKNFLSKNFYKQGEFFYYHSDIPTRVEKNAHLSFLFMYGKHGWLLIIGDFTTKARSEAIDQIPFAKERYRQFIQKMGEMMGTHSKRMARTIFNQMPIEMKFTLPVHGYEEIFLFLSRVYFHPKSTLNISWFGKYRTVILLTLPEGKFNSSTIDELKESFSNYFPESQINVYIQFEPDIVKIYYLVFSINRKILATSKKEDEIIDNAKVMLRSWQDELREEVIKRFSGTTLDEVLDKYIGSFEKNYVHNNTIKQAMEDIRSLLKLSKRKFHVTFQKSVHRDTLRLFSTEEKNITDLLPVLSGFGLIIQSEISSKIKTGDKYLYIYIFAISPESLPLNARKFSEAMSAAFLGKLTPDNLNALLLKIDIDWKSLSLLKSILSYASQTVTSWSMATLTKGLLKFSDFALYLIQFVEETFISKNPKAQKALENKMNEIIAGFTNLEEDRILRQCLGIVLAMERTNYPSQREAFQDLTDEKTFYISFKISSRKLPILDEPRPLCEIFVFSPIMNGVHLRGGRIARGGIRWSERPDDYRTEILGLMKTQMVKNAVIVPVGSKGGFIVKNPAVDKKIFLEQGKKAYRTLICGLLDLTDNYKNGSKKPIDLYSKDDFDPYLVVAADKGTANFSDIANDISGKYDFWLTDAFASGGTYGYNHKEYGITARGAWESIKRHFYEMGKNIYESEFTVVAIGDMSGDVFGNGMLYTDKIKLIGAFNHLHILIDPAPDALISYRERKRIFSLPRGGWDQYNKKLISKGGGIFSRNEANIIVTPEMSKLLSTTEKKLNGQQVVKLLLKCKTDLLFNGGIGTYIKAKEESHFEVGDKANDSVRVDGQEIQAAVVGEGGNLGLTQKGRIEYSLTGGKIFTDALDNSAGVDMSDHEVNLKILLSDLMAKKKINLLADRNRLLKSIGGDVAGLVIKDNFLQAMSVAMDYKRSQKNPYPFLETITFLEKEKILNRDQEFIPDNTELIEYGVQKRGLTRPILSVLLGYIKIYLYNALHDDNHFRSEQFHDLFDSYFPEKIIKKFKKYIYSHKLKKEIIITIMTNNFVNILGTSALIEISQNPSHHVQIVKNWFILNLITDGITFRKEIFKLQNKLTIEEYDNILLLNARNYKQAIAYILMMEITLDNNFLDSLAALMNNLKILDINHHCLWNGSGKLSALAKTSDKTKKLFHKSLVSKTVIRAIHIECEYFYRRDSRVKRATDPKKNGRLKKRKNKIAGNILKIIYLLENDLNINELRIAIEKFITKNTWEKNFKERLILRLEKHENRILHFLIDNNIFSDNKVKDAVANWKLENALLSNILEEMGKRDADLLFLEYLVENSLGNLSLQ